MSIKYSVLFFKNCAIRENCWKKLIWYILLFFYVKIIIILRFCNHEVVFEINLLNYIYSFTWIEVYANIQFIRNWIKLNSLKFNLMKSIVRINAFGIFLFPMLNTIYNFFGFNIKEKSFTTIEEIKKPLINICEDC